MSIVTNQLFDTHNVSVFKIPPGDVSLSRWETKGSNVVWRGSLRLIEEEEVAEDDSRVEKEPYQVLRLKLDFYNQESTGGLSDEFNELGKEHVWAESWYNPFRELGIECSIANDGGDAVKMTPESPKYYRIVLQLPGSGYHPFPQKKASEKQSVLQVALGMKFEDSFNAMSFSESIGIYRRRFKAYQEKYLYDKHLSKLQHKILNDLTISEKESRENTPASDDDDFGNFVSSSYD
ncbi:hypothetical protein FT663_01730 [Candidozyma haemuli var. vulneris]|uniref:Uncharacterized protein n=1 Tax=Candidozyma haemuli TaxID=45357 RepID=A0A2V1ATF3_9ASCO|nr:hypothetical protein CXQ85_002357 [[Candida] haemuloni]KAF3985812.1 hypothetical protein FT662_04922 [[Candida] haemuloni var. vulneris]KAF3993741.1 hypothetical protein FT663_01730 [[Candida] haemuloni var. vulneris]PVH20563.1 hypothetical protein CXQ85_002357 [[Candida] haemuloni]